jgi:hypothetical protein
MLRGMRLRHAWLHRIGALPSISCPGPAQPDPKILGDRGCPNQYSAMMPDYEIMAIPGESRRSSAVMLSSDRGAREKHDQ